jgi:hypothetical protein
MAIGVRRPYFVFDEDEPENLFDENMPPRRRKDRIDGSDTTMMATAISAIDKISTRELECEHDGQFHIHIQTLFHAWITSMVAKRTILMAMVMIPSENVATRPHIWRRLSCNS